MNQSFLWTVVFWLYALVILSSCDTPAATSLESDTQTIEIQSLVVMATAYNSVPSQTHEEHPSTAAWGDKLDPGMKCIAVSRDLIPQGLEHKTEVSISGLSGTYLVLDKMNARYSNAIDIYMGLDKDAALNWGRKEVTIRWKVD